MTMVLSASSISGDKVTNREGEDLGDMKEIMIDLQSGRVAYAVVSFGGGFLKSGKLFAVPWESLAVDLEAKKVVLDVPRETLESAEGFDDDQWPDMATHDFRTRTYGHFGVKPW